MWRPYETFMWTDVNNNWRLRRHQFWTDVGPPSTTSTQHWWNISTKHQMINILWHTNAVWQPHSRVKNLTFMTTFWLRCFDDWFDFLEPFKKYLALVSLVKIPAFFSRVVNPKWAPAPLWKNNFWHIKATNMNKYTFLGNSTTRNPFLTSIWYQNTFLTLKSKIADKFG